MQPSLFRCSGTLDLCIRSIASRRALGCELRDGLDGWRSPVPRGDNTGGRDYVTAGTQHVSMFWDFGSLHQKHRVGGTHDRVRRDGSDGWRSPVPRGDNTGGRGRVLPPPTIRCQSRRQVQNILMHLGVDSVRDGRLSTSRWVPFLGFVLGLRFTLPEARCGVISLALSRQPELSSVSLRRLRLGVAAQASGTSLPRCFRYSRR